MNGEDKKQGAGRALPAIIVLACICLGSGAGVSVLYSQMKELIARKEQEVFRDALAVVLGEADEYPPIGDYAEGTPDDEIVRMATGASGVLYCAVGSAKGYGGPIKVLVAVKADAPGTPLSDDPEIHCTTVVSSTETPGLGENIRAVEREVSLWGAIAGKTAPPRRPWFQEQFSGKRLSDLAVTKDKGGPGIVAVTGATISSRATVEAVRDAVGRIIKRTGEVF